MYEAMARARLGDDVYGEDPTVNELEALAADRVGKQAGLFVASGTMANLCAILSHTTRGDEAMGGFDSHTFRAEAGGMATLGGVVPRPLATDPDGKLDPAEVRAAIRPDDPHYPRSRLILLENSYARRSGTPLPPKYFAEIAAIAGDHELVTHLDGARLFNAAVALDVPASEITRHVDSVSFCLSKGLCAPVGSMLCGSLSFIDQARRVRKVLGGGMRQAGILAAAGIVAICDMVERLGQDHANAQLLAQGLSRISGIEIDPAVVRTNIVYFGLADEVSYSAQQVVDRLSTMAGVLVGVDGARSFRALTHLYIGRTEVETLLQALEETLIGDV